MKGSVVRPDGRYKTWRIRWEGPRDVRTGRRRQYQKAGFPTEREARKALRKFLVEVDEGRFVAPSKQTLGEYLGEWLTVIKASIRPSTWENYGILLRSYVIPRLGSVRLLELRPQDLNSLYAELLESGRQDGRGGLSPRSVRYVHTVVHRALKDGLKWGKLSRNVADQADPPKQRRAQMSTWSAGELAAFLKSVEADLLYPVWVLLAMTGMRRGEVLGLRWRDVDLATRRIAVRGSVILVNNRPELSETKTGANRSVPIPVEAVVALKAHRSAQAEDKLILGAGWRGDLVFCRPGGLPIDPGSVSKRFDRLVRESGLPRISPHGLRHTWATLALGSGVPTKVVSEILGHKTISVTSDIYQHVIPAMQEEAVSLVAGAIFEHVSERDVNIP